MQCLQQKWRRSRETVVAIDSQKSTSRKSMMWNIYVCMWSQCYSSSLERPDRINRTTVLSVKAVVEKGPTVLMTPTMCVGTGFPCSTHASCLWSIKNWTFRSNFRMSLLVQECFDSSRIQTKPRMMIASGFIGKLKPKFFLPSRKKAAGGLYLGSYFTTALMTPISSSLLKSGMIMSPRSMLLTQLTVCTIPSIWAYPSKPLFPSTNSQTECAWISSKFRRLFTSVSPIMGTTISCNRKFLSFQLSNNFREIFFMVGFKSSCEIKSTWTVSSARSLISNSRWATSSARSLISNSRWATFSAWRLFSQPIGSFSTSYHLSNILWKIKNSYHLKENIDISLRRRSVTSFFGHIFCNRGFINIGLRKSNEKRYWALAE